MSTPDFFGHSARIVLPREAHADNIDAPLRLAFFEGFAAGVNDEAISDDVFAPTLEPRFKGWEVGQRTRAVQLGIRTTGDE